MARYRVGICGLGRIASTIDDEVAGNAAVMLPYSHTAAWREVPEVEVVAGCDPLAEKRHAFAARWGIASVHETLASMLAAEQPDIVSVCTRTEDRVEAVLACAEAGVRAVYAEKPLAQSLAEADRLVAECEARGIVLAVGCTRRWDAWHRATRELVASGRLGTPRQVTGMLHCGLSHNGSHLIDIVRFHAGDAPVEWVFGEMESDEAAAGEADLAGNGYLRFANGVTGFVRALPCGPVGVEVDVLCDDGRVRGLGNGIEWELWRAGGSYRGLSREPFPRPQRIRSPNLAAAHDVVACLAHGGTPACSGRDGLAALEIAIALRQSHRERARIALPLADRGLRIVPHA